VTQQVMALVQNHHADPGFSKPRQGIASSRMQGVQGLSMLREHRPGLSTIDGDALLVVRRVVGRKIANPRRCFLR
jgi:hypothetical protein